MTLAQRSVVRARTRLPSIILATTLVSITLAAQSSSTAVTASVTVRLTANKTAFRIGEEIPLQLEFRGTAGDDYYFSTETYDRSGRMTTERYELTPQTGFADP